MHPSTPHPALKREDPGEAPSPALTAHPAALPPPSSPRGGAFVGWLPARWRFWVQLRGTGILTASNLECFE